MPKHNKQTKRPSKALRIANGFSYVFLAAVSVLFVYAYQTKVPKDTGYSVQDRAQLDSVIQETALPAELPVYSDSAVVPADMAYEDRFGMVWAYLLTEEAR